MPCKKFENMLLVSIENTNMTDGEMDRHHTMA